MHVELFWKAGIKTTSCCQGDTTKPDFEDGYISVDVGYSPTKMLILLGFKNGELKFENGEAVKAGQWGQFKVSLPQTSFLITTEDISKTCVLRFKNKTLPYLYTYFKAKLGQE